jgi:hypothetical protein
VSLNASRNASNWEKINDGFDGTLGLSLALPPMLLPPAFLPVSSRNARNQRPRVYPLNMNLSSSIRSLGYADEAPPPYPFFPTERELDSVKTACEFLWSPGIFQLRNRWAYTVFENKENQTEASLSGAVRFKNGRLSVRVASPDFPEKWNYTVSWRLEK